LEFLDTNVFIYAFDPDQAVKHEIATKLIESGLRSQGACSSWQVVQEFANVVTRKFVAKATPQEARLFIDNVIEPMNRVASSTELVHTALALREELRYGFYDSLIIAAALQARCSTLYSEDLQHGQVVRGGLAIVNPFAGAMHEPLAAPVVSYQLRYTGK
jgi:predicted nucleic acid-binding protein